MRRFFVTLTIPALILLAASQAGCGNDAQSKQSDGESETDDAPGIPVEAASVIEGEISAYFTGTATLEAEDEATVVAKAGGIVTEIFVEEGDYVKAGQALAQLDDERLALELARTEATLGQLERQYKRNEELHAQKLVSAEEYERIRSEFEAQRAARDLAKLALEHTTVRAPIGGVVSRRLVKVGNMVQTYDATFGITSFDPLLAIMHVPERELNRLVKGQRSEVTFDALPGDNFYGRIERISPVLDASTGTFKVTVELRDRSGKLKPGMFGRIRVVYDTHPSAMLVPKEAVVAEDDAANVFVIRDSMSFRQPVSVGYEDDRFIEVLSGISIGDQVITTGQSNLRDSSKVEVIDESVL